MESSNAATQSSPGVQRRRQNAEMHPSHVLPDEPPRLASVFEERQVSVCASTTPTLRSVSSRTGRTPNIAFVIDLLENATSKGTLTDAEAINAFDQWLTDKIAPYYADSTTSQRLVTSDDSGIGSQSRCYNSDSCPSAQTSISDCSGVLSSVSEPSLSPRPRLRRSESLNHRHRSTGRIFVKSISRLFAACGAPKTDSSPPAEGPGHHLPHACYELRRGSNDRPLPEVPVTLPEPVYAEYDVLGNIPTAVLTSSPSPPAIQDEYFDSIYDEAEPCLDAPGHVSRLDSGFDSV